MQQLVCRVLVGRDDEVAAVEDAVRAVATGRGGALFVVGEAGVGKSRLAMEARARAEAAGFRVLSGRAVDRTAPQPYRPLAEALQGALPLDAEPDDPTLQPLGRALRRLLPHRDAEPASEPGELAMADALVRYLGVAGRGRGCLLLLEDLHWADPETLAVVEYLADHIAGHPALLVGTVRTGESGGAERLVQLLGERRAVTVLRLSRLSPEATEVMVANCLDTGSVPAAVGEFVRAHAEGVPLFVEELLTGLVTAGALARGTEGWEVRSRLSPVVPLTYAEAVRRRLDSLTTGDRQVAVAAALLGRTFDWSVLPAATGRDREAVLDSLRRLTAAGLVGPDQPPTAFRFSHALIRDAVLGELLPPEQAAAAARVLAAVEAAHRGLPGEWADLAADLAERAGDRHRAVAALVSLAREALSRGAVGSAQAALARAAELARRQPDLVLDVDEVTAQAAALAGDVDAAIRRAAAVLTALPSGPDADERRTRLHLTLARAALVAGRWGDAWRHASDALSLTATGHEALRASAEALASQIAIADERPEEAAALARSAVEHGRAAGVPAAVCEALEVMGRLVRGKDPQEAEGCFEQALRVAEDNGLDLWRARALHELGTIDLVTSKRGDRFSAARQAAVDAGAVALIALCDLHLAAVAGASWELQRGVEAARRCVDLSGRLGLNTLGMGLIHLATCHAMAGQAGEAEAVIAEATRLADEQPDVAAGIPGRVRSWVHLRSGDLAGTAAELDQAVTVLRKHPSLEFPFWGLWALLRTVLDQEGASARAEAASAPGSAYALNRCCVALASALEAGRGGDENATRLVEEALGHLREGQAHPWGTVVLAVVADSALREGWGDGPRWARQALASFEAAGLEELSSWCRSMLREAGQPVPRRRGRPAPADLRALGVTSRELDVLELLVAGVSNAEIARRLHLSPRTVERHVSNLLTKTDSTDRRDLARLARHTGIAAAT